MVKRLFALLAAVLLLAALHVLWDHHQLDVNWRTAFANPDAVLQPGELFQYAALVGLGIPAAVLFSAAWSDAAFARFARSLLRAGYLLPALLSSIGAALITRYVTEGAWYTDDEQGYFFQMHSYLHGMLSEPALSPEWMFHHPFVVVARVENGVEWWAGAYPIMQPMLMALSSLLGNPSITQWLCAGLIVYHSGRLVETLTGERALGVCAAWICSASPMLLGLAATYHTAVLGTALSVLSMRTCLAALASPTLLRGALLGACAGAAFLTRPLEGSLMVVVTFGMLCVLLRTRLRAAWPVLLGFAVMGAAALAVYFVVNLRVTGSPLETTYGLWAKQYGRIMGFGTNMMWGRSHSPAQGLSQTFTTIVRMNTWEFGWPSALILPLLGLLPRFRTRAGAWLLVLSLAQLCGYFFLAFGSVHDFGGSYHVWHMPWIVCGNMLMLQRAREHVPGMVRVLMGMTLVGLAAFLPTQLRKWHDTALATLAPIRAAEKVAAGRPAVVLWSNMHTPGVTSWVHWPPAPIADAPLLWTQERGQTVEQLRSVQPTRIVLRLTWIGAQPVAQELGN